ncbi:collagen alpha-4(VI) chain-like protein [Camelus ferus]|nr:collagen alpha-4(VI) chain-like protein [Camelus ferus]
MEAVVRVGRERGLQPTEGEPRTRGSTSGQKPPESRGLSPAREENVPGTRHSSRSRRARPDLSPGLLRELPHHAQRSEGPRWNLSGGAPRPSPAQGSWFHLEEKEALVRPLPGCTGGTAPHPRAPTASAHRAVLGRHGLLPPRGPGWLSLCLDGSFLTSFKPVLRCHCPQEASREKEVPEVFLDSEVRTDAGAGEDPRAALVRRVLTAWMENRVIVESQGHLEKKETGEIGEVLTLMDLTGELEVLALRVCVENLVNKVTQESLGIQAHRDQEEGKDRQELWEKKAHRVLRVFLAQMDMDIQEEKEQRVNLDFLATLVHKEKMVIQAPKEKRGQKESEGRGSKVPMGEAGADLGALEKPEVPCEIIHLARENCRVSRCPVFPTDLVFALDTSNDVSQLEFERMRDIVVSLLMKMEISGGNCRTGARVAVVSYNSRTDHLVRFSDYRGRPALLRALREMALEAPSGSRSLGGAMRFVARHLFKRVRSGLLLRKVAVFFQAGWAQDADTISTATLELSALGITSAIITFTEGHNLPEALLVRGGRG